MVVLCYIPLFGHLGNLAIRIYDESRLASNAYLMHKNGNWLVTYFDGKPDMWNTKPPLMIWLQVLFIKLIGFSELAIRLPSAISAFILCGGIVTFFYRIFKEWYLGFIVVMVLITCHGYVNLHATRTGDYDSLLTLFTTLYCLLYFLFLESNKKALLYGFFVCLTFSILAKSVTGLLFLPGLFIYTIYRKKVLEILKNKHVYIGFLIPVTVCFVYYYSRELVNPGYLKAVFENELGGRYLNVIEEHKASFWYYYLNFIDFQLYPIWYLLLIPGFLIGMFHSNEILRRITIFSATLLVCFFLVISTAKTKLEWYDVPMYPFIAILIGIFIWFVVVILFNYKTTFLRWNILPFVFLFLIFITPYRRMVNKTYLPQEYSWEKEFYNISYYLKDVMKGHESSKDLIFLGEGYAPQIDFYLKQLDENKRSFIWKDKAKLAENDKVVCYQQEVKDYLYNHYEMEQIGNRQNIIYFKINGKKIAN